MRVCVRAGRRGWVGKGLHARSPAVAARDSSPGDASSRRGGRERCPRVPGAGERHWESAARRGGTDRDRGLVDGRPGLQRSAQGAVTASSSSKGPEPVRSQVAPTPCHTSLRSAPSLEPGLQRPPPLQTQGMPCPAREPLGVRCRCFCDTYFTRKWTRHEAVVPLWSSLWGPLYSAPIWVSRATG